MHSYAQDSPDSTVKAEPFYVEQSYVAQSYVAP